MVKSQYVSLQDAALLSGKSPQTIRRLIKGNKVRYRKYKTPQGFTYLVEKTSLVKHFDINEEDPMEEAELVEEFDPSTETEAEDSPIVEQVKSRPKQNNYEQERPAAGNRAFNGANPSDPQFQTIITQLVHQHRDDKKRLFELLEMFQKRILVLEDQLKQLEPPKQKKRRFLFW